MHSGSCRQTVSNLNIRRLILKIPNGLLRATRLVRTGNLIAATEAIQRALRGGDAPTAPPDDADAIEGSFRVVAPPAAEGRRRPAPARSTATPASETGRFLAGAYASAAGTREYKTYIPAGFHGQALPVVVMLHGCKQGIDDFAAGTRMNEVADQHGVIVVYPGQPRKANGSNCWNWFEPGHQQRDTGEPSLIAGITRQVLAEYGADRQHVYVAGLSAGGAMATIMGATYPELFAAVGNHSGLPYAAARDVPSAFAAMRGQRSGRARPKSRRQSVRAVPTIVFHGASDSTVHPSNGEEVIAQASSPTADAAARDDGSGSLEKTVEQGDASGRGYTRTTYRDGAGKPVVEHWLVHGADHAWSGGSSKGSYSDPHGPDASREMLRFFLQHESS